jgi:hypothetical protein
LRRDLFRKHLSREFADEDLAPLGPEDFFDKGPPIRDRVYIIEEINRDRVVEIPATLPTDGLIRPPAREESGKGFAGVIARNQVEHIIK